MKHPIAARTRPSPPMKYMGPTMEFRGCLDSRRRDRGNRASTKEEQPRIAGLAREEDVVVLPERDDMRAIRG